MPDLGLTVSATTRKPREGEIDGVSYHFMDDKSFDDAVKNGEFLEWAHVHGHKYGTLRKEVDKFLNAGKSVVLEIDVQGAISVRKIYPDCVLLFVEPPSPAVLESRLRSRATENEADIELRLKNAAREMGLENLYDVRIVNDDLDRASKELEAAIVAYEEK